MFEAYADGVNTFITSDEPLPVEYALAGIDCEPWEPWHSVLTFKVRHAIMGKRLTKLARAELLRRVGLDTYVALEGIEPPGHNVILPPGGAVSAVIAQSAERIAALATDLGTLGSDEGGSNSWVVHGSRTTTGLPVLCNDSHRPLDVPNVYWQVHVNCPGFNVAGGAFPGFPALPHFGQNGTVAWNITHGQADYQDLYLEQFNDDATATRADDLDGGWADAEARDETIEVRDAEAVAYRTWVTRHGPVIDGDPSAGTAIAMRYTATDRANTQWKCLRPMLTSATVEELFETQRGWEEPVNALLAADIGGDIGMLYRGRVPVRSTDAGQQLPVPGWQGEHDWTGDVPFEELPCLINPQEGFIGTANQQPWDRTEPYLAYEFTTPGRAERIAEVLRDRSSDPLTPAAIAHFQGDVTSVRARDWVRFLAAHPPLDGDAERARAMLASWDGELRPDSGAALLYAHARRELAQALFAPLVGEETWSWLQDGSNTGATRLVSGWLFHVASTLEGSDRTPDGRAWPSVLQPALEAAWRTTADTAGSAQPSDWRWDAVHRTTAAHTLSVAHPDEAARLDPPSVAVGGDSDTLQVSGASLAIGASFAITGLSVYRQVVDLAAPLEASWIVPAGASGHPASPHYADQLESWQGHERIPMHLDPSAAKAAAEHTLTLTPRA
jgi:penicillin amidase